MSQEINITGQSTGLTLYAIVWSGMLVWQTTNSMFVVFNPSNVAHYAIAMTGDGSGDYSASFPYQITTPGTYGVYCYQQTGGSPSTSDNTLANGEIIWDGHQEITVATQTALGSTQTNQNFIGAPTGDASLLDYLNDVATAVVNNICRRPNGFLAAEYTEDYEGTDDWTLQLRQHPVTSVTQVVYNAYGQQPITVTGDQFILDKPTGQISPKPTTTMGNYFMSGWGLRHQVTYSAGYVDTPADIQQAVAMIVQRMYQQKGTELLATTEKLGDYQATYTLAQSICSDSFDVMKLLGKYVDYTTN